MLKETDTKKHNTLLILFLSLVEFQWGGRGGFAPLSGHTYDEVGFAMGNSIRLLLAILLLDLQQDSSFAETLLSKIFFADFSKKIF